MKKEALISELENISKNYGGKMSIDGRYPAWEYRENSRLRECMVSVFEQMFMREPVVGAVHAGLECGLLSAKLTTLTPYLSDLTSLIYTRLRSGLI